MEIVKYNENSLPVPVVQALQTLQPEQQKFVNAGLTVKVKALPPVKAVTDLVGIVTLAFTIAGQQPEPETLALYADELYNKVMSEYPALTVDEIRAAVRAGVYGDYGKYYGINPKSLFGFVQSYALCEERIEALKKFDKSKTLQLEYKISDDANRQNNIDFANDLYRSFLNGAINGDGLPAYMYDFLQRENKLYYCNCERREFFKQAERHLNTIFVNERTAKMMREISETVESTLFDKHTRIVLIAKRFALKEFFIRSALREKETIF